MIHDTCKLWHRVVCIDWNLAYIYLTNADQDEWCWGSDLGDLKPWYSLPIFNIPAKITSLFNRTNATKKKYVSFVSKYEIYGKIFIHCQHDLFI